MSGQQFITFPYPVLNSIYLYSAEGKKIESVIIYDAVGNLVAVKKSQLDPPIDLGIYTSGIYLLVIELFDDTLETHKVIKL